MKKKESWIPLLVTLVVLGYFVFWAIGYVARNKPPKEEQPTTLARAVKVDPVTTEPAAAVATPAPEPAQAAPRAAPTSFISGDQAGDVLEDNPDNKPVQNRKMFGIARETNTRH